MPWKTRCDGNSIHLGGGNSAPKKSEKSESKLFMSQVKKSLKFSLINVIDLLDSFYNFVIFFVLMWFLPFFMNIWIVHHLVGKRKPNFLVQLRKLIVLHKTTRRQTVKWTNAAVVTLENFILLTNKYFQTRDNLPSMSVKKATVSKGSVLLKMGKIKKLENGGEDGKSYLCQMGQDCTFSGTNLADVARHITGSHERKGPVVPGLFNSQPPLTPAGKRGKRKAEEVIAGDEKRTELDDDETLIDIRRILDDSDMETDAGVMGEDGILRPTSPDKSYRIQPTEEEMKEKLGQDNFFIEKKVSESSDEVLAIPIPKIKIDETDDLEETSKYLICEICGPEQPVWDPAGIHMYEQHREQVVYAPHLWIGSKPAYMVAPMTEKTEVKALVSCINELRNRVELDETYFSKREDSVGYYKTSMTSMMEKMNVIKKQSEAAMKRVAESNEAHESVMSAAEDKEGEAKMLKSKVAVLTGQNQKMNEKIREQRITIAEQKKKNSLEAISSGKSAESAAITADKISKLETTLKLTEQKVVLHQSKVKKLEAEAIKTAKDKVEVEKQLKEASDLLAQYAADLDPENDDEMDVDETACTTVEEEEKDTDTDDSSTDTESSDSSSEEEHVKRKINMKRKCIFFEKKTGCKKGDKCLFLHPTEECKDFIRLKCEGKCLKFHNHEKKKEFKQKKESATETKDKSKVKKKDCLAWLEGRCPHHRKGKTSCEAGEHKQERWASKEVKNAAAKSSVEVSASPALKKGGKVKGSGVKPSLAPVKTPSGNSVTKSKSKTKVKKSKKSKKSKKEKE